MGENGQMIDEMDDPEGLKKETFSSRLAKRRSQRVGHVWDCRRCRT